MKVKSYFSIFLVTIFLTSQAQAVLTQSDYPFQEAEKYIDRIIERNLPYERQILNINWSTKDHNTYPAGSLTKMFATYLIENNIIKDKTVADIGSSSFAIGVIAAKNSAKEVVGTCITYEATKNAQENIVSNNVGSIAHVIEGSGARPLLSQYKGKIDVIVSGPPWNTISSEDFNKIEESRKALTKLFYDIDDIIITDVLSNAPLLLAPGGKIYITASSKIMDRIKHLCELNHMTYKIVKEEDIHKDKNIHYILMLTPEKKEKIYVN